MTRRRDAHRKGVPAGCPLTTKEYEVIRLLGDGLTYSQIGHQTGRATGTIRTQLHTAYKRLGVAGSIHAVIHCYKAGWITPDGIPDPPSRPAPAPKVRRENQVTGAQALYLQAFQRWVRTNSPDDRAEAQVLLRIVRREAAKWSATHERAKAA